eukprot:876131-Amphidinium_carterae.1
MKCDTMAAITLSGQGGRETGGRILRKPRSARAARGMQVGAKHCGNASLTAASVFSASVARAPMPTKWSIYVTR